MKLVVSSTFDPEDASSWSGCSHNLIKALRQDCGWDVESIGPLFSPLTVRDKMLARLYNLMGKNYLPAIMPRHLECFARQAQERLAYSDADAVLALDSHTLYSLETDKPVFYYWDCTFAGNLEYPWFANLAKSCIEAGHTMEQRALDRCRMAFFASRWALESAHRRYGKPLDDLRLVPLAANLSAERSRHDVEVMVNARSTDCIELVFIGVDWLRKGGALALAVAGELNRRCHPARLHVVGCEPDCAGSPPDYLVAHGFLRKQDAEERERLEGLIAKAHFLVVPSLAESFGAVFAEASSFGTPSLGRRVGGVESVVKDGVNGMLFDRNAGPEEYADYILARLAEPQAYRALAMQCFEYFSEELTWRSSAGKLAKYIQLSLAK